MADAPIPEAPRTDLPAPSTLQGPNPQEWAILSVGGQSVRDFESVFVQVRWAEPFSIFQFTMAERDTPFVKLQFMPGQQCNINLAGVDVIRGIIDTRQVAYTATQHNVQLTGKSDTSWISRSSVSTETGSFDGMTFQQVAQKVLADYPAGIKVIGNLNAIPFDKLQNQPGEQIWDFLERIARPRGIVLGSDSFGNFLLIGDHNFPVINTQLIEGQNIKTCQCVIHKEQLYQMYKVLAQSAASDDNAFTAASELEGVWGGSAPFRSLLITPSEQPVKSQQEVTDRARNEALWHEAPQIDVTVNVQGWLRDGSNLWWPGDKVYIYSPSAPLDMVMKIYQVTFTQDNRGGTMTRLDLLPPWGLKDMGSINPGPVQNPVPVAPKELDPTDPLYLSLTPR